MSSHAELETNQYEINITVFHNGEISDHSPLKVGCSVLCSPENMQTMIQSDPSRRKIVVVSRDQVSNMLQLLNDRSIHKVLIVNNVQNVHAKANPWPAKIRIVPDEKDLMRYVYMEIMHCLFLEGKSLQGTGDIGLGNARIREAISVLDYVKSCYM